MESESQKPPIGKQLKIERTNPDRIRPVPANDLVITHSKQDFFLTFSSIEMPPIVEEKDLDSLQNVEAIARAKLVISLDFAEAIVRALSINIETFKKGTKTNVSKE